jgi:arginine-tRNA-protein transferase
MTANSSDAQSLRVRVVKPFLPTRRLRFFLTSQQPCAYLPDRAERKVFARLPMSEGAPINDALTESGFRRSQGIAYRPACDTCAACLSVRAPVAAYAFSRSERRTLDRNRDLVPHLVEAEATREQFDLLSRYLKVRHAYGGMAEMSWLDYVAMVEETTVRTHILEYRSPSLEGGPGELLAAVLVDVLADGLSLVYSFYDPDLPRRSLGRFMILDHIVQAQQTGLPYVYLGYWVPGSAKMAYKAGLRPLEVLRFAGWTALTDEDRQAPAPPAMPRRDPAARLPVARSRRAFGS